MEIMSQRILFLKLASDYMKKTLHEILTMGYKLLLKDGLALEAINHGPLDLQIGFYRLF
jgi:hypothetical protein